MIKVIGAVIGFFLLGGSFIGAILGFLFAGSFERFQNYGSGGFNPFTQGNRQAVFLRTVFLLKGKLAKADGHISQAEVDHTENFIRQLGMSAEHRQQAIKWFKQGSAADFHVESTLQEFMAACGQTRNLPQVLLVYLIVMAMADGVMDRAEESLLRSIGAQLGYSEAQFRQLLDMTLNQSHFAGGSAGASPSALDEAYKALGVESSCSDQELKRAYRKLMSQYHPDKLMGQGVPEDMLKVATEQAKEIQAAYDLIKKNRGL
ncbi:co-chaperone DjlA [Porticoccus sp. GXU_MW_L64]